VPNDFGCGLEGSFEDGPETLIDHAKRDRRWCQGNLQHTGVLGAAGLAHWHRFTFVQGISAYVAPVFWMAFLALSIWAAVTAQPATPGFPFLNTVTRMPVATPGATGQATFFFAVVASLLFVPKLGIVLHALHSGRAGAFGGSGRALLSALAEIAVSSTSAPILLMFQTRAVCQVLAGRDAGWPAQSREGGAVPLPEAWQASR